MMSPVVRILPRLTLQVVRTGGDQFHILATERTSRKPHQHQPLLVDCGSAYKYVGYFMHLTWLSTGAS